MNRTPIGVISGLAALAALQAMSQEAPKAAVFQEERAPICFETSRLCLPRKQPASVAKTRETAAGQVPAPALKLGIPREQMLAVAARINAAAPDTEEEPLSSVQVEGQRDAPDIPGGLGSLIWAAKNPTQAWRIFLPAPSK